MGKKYDLAIFDMDGTLTTANSSWRFILEEFGGENHDTYMQWVNGEIDESEFMRRDIAIWKEAKPDVSAKDIAKMMRAIPLIDGIQETVAALHYNNIKCAICSGGILCAAKMIADEYGFDYYIADAKTRALCCSGNLLSYTNMLSLANFVFINSTNHVDLPPLRLTSEHRSDLP